MRIPSPGLTFGPLSKGQSASAEHAQFGRVELNADGRIDPGFKQLPGQHDVAGWTDLADPGLLAVLNACGSAAVDSLSQARARFEEGIVPDYSLKSQIEATHGAQIRKALQDAKIPASVYVTVDNRGVMTNASLHLNGRGHCGDQAQNLSFQHSREGISAVLSSRRFDGEHKITVPFSSEGKVQPDQATEELTLRTPWLYGQSLTDVGEQGIHSLEDGRLERLAAAAEMGFLLPDKDLGQDWQVKSDGTRQTFKYGNQEVLLDTQSRTFLITSTSSHSARGGEVDYDVKDAIRWRNGRLERLNSADSGI